jgi:hypothetical protein
MMDLHLLIIECHFILLKFLLEPVIMENLLEDVQNQEVLLDREVFTKIWTSPKRVLKYISDTKCK